MFKMTIVKNHLLKTITEFSLFVRDCCPVAKKPTTSLSAEPYNLTHCACTVHSSKHNLSCTINNYKMGLNIIN